MLRTASCRTAIALVLGTLLTVASPAYAGPQQKNTPASEKAPAGAAQGWLAGFLDILGSIWDAAGCGIDPHGGCTASTTDEPPRLDLQDIGCDIDPHGCTR